MTTSKILLGILLGFLCYNPETLIHAQELTLEEIKINLIENPPNSGDLEIRKQSILSLDEILIDPLAQTSQDVFNFYVFMMEKVKTEIMEDVHEGAKIWIMYNHGFIVKTPEIVFAFDLIDGYTDWQHTYSYKLPKEILQQIKVLFISHGHDDHSDGSVQLTIKQNGGDVIWSSGFENFTISGLHVNVYEGLHSRPTSIFEVTTPNNIKIVHTGDNQTSQTLPILDSVDVLLLNGWVNESGRESSVVGMNNCIDKLKPKIMIPGHFQELAHEYNPGDPKGRKRYELAYQLPHYDSTDVMVMAWGELYHVNDLSIGINIGDQTASSRNNSLLSQNFPNPFNPSTKINYSIKNNSYVSLKVFDVLGREIETLINKEQPVGNYSIEFDASGLTSGIYFYRIQAGDFVETKKMVLMR